MRQLLQELFENYYREVYGYLYSLCRDASLAEDLASEVFLEVVKSIGSFQGRSDIKTWLFSIARHRWFAWLRKNGHTEDRVSDFLPAQTKSPESHAEDREAAQRIMSLLENEPERTRRILSLRMEGYSFHEIADLLDISDNSARVIEFRAKCRIRKILKEEGFYND